MNQTDPMKSLLVEAFPAAEPSGGLEQRVARQIPHPARRAPWIAVGSAVAAAGGLAAIGLFAGAPTLALADVILQEAENVHGHVRMYTVGSNGKRTLTGEAWVEADRIRTISYQPHGRDELVDAKAGFDVTWNRSMHAFDFYQGDERQRLMIAKALYSGNLEALRKLPGINAAAKMTTGAGTFDGQIADFVELRLPGVRWIGFADPKSHRILGLQIYSREPKPGPIRVVFHRGAKRLPIVDEGPIVEREMVIDDRVADPSVFRPMFDVDGVRFDVYQRRDEVRAKLAHGIATYEVPGGQVVIRDVSMNPHGDVFVLYTGNGARYGQNVIPVIVSDKTGGVYAKGYGFRPYNPWSNANDWHGFSFDGKGLEGAWFPRVDGPVPSDPITIGFKRESEPMTNLAFRHTQEPVRVPGPVPDSMMFMGTPLAPSTLTTCRDECAAEYFTDDVHDYARGEVMWRKEIADTESDPSERLPWPHYSLGVCLARQKKYSQAIKELSLAKKAAADQGATNIAGMIDNELRSAKRAAGMKP